MPRFIVFAKEIHTVRIEVEADDLNSARLAAYNVYRENIDGEVDPPLPEPEYSTVMPLDTWWPVPAALAAHIT
jgi:hypothetical protein